MSGGCSSCTQLSYLNYIYLTKQTYDMIQFTYFNLSFRTHFFLSFGISEVKTQKPKMEKFHIYEEISVAEGSSSSKESSNQVYKGRERSTIQVRS